MWQFWVWESWDGVGERNSVVVIFMWLVAVGLNWLRMLRMFGRAFG